MEAIQSLDAENRIDPMIFLESEASPQISIQQRPQQSNYPLEYYNTPRGSYCYGSNIATYNIHPELVLWKAEGLYTLQKESNSLNPAIQFRAPIEKPLISDRNKVILDLYLQQVSKGGANIPSGYTIKPEYEGCDFFVITVNGHVLGNIIRYPEMGPDFNEIEFPAEYLREGNDNLVTIELVTSHENASYVCREIALSNSNWPEPICYKDIPQEPGW